MSVLKPVLPKPAASSAFKTSLTHRPESTLPHSIADKAWFNHQKEHRGRRKEFRHCGWEVCRVRCRSRPLSRKGGIRETHLSIPQNSATQPRVGGPRRTRIKATSSEGSEARNGPEDELSLRERLNAISHKRPFPHVNGTALSSKAFGASPAARPNDSLSPQISSRDHQPSNPSQPPPVLRASHRPDVVGVLGGISPRATADFMRQVIQATPAASNKDHIPLVVSSIPQIPSLSAPILNRPVGSPSEAAVMSPLPAMLETRKFLEQAGAQCIVMPSNMAHFWYDQLALDCSVPFLHIADAVAEELDRARLEPLEAGSQPKVGLLASEATLKAGIYQRKLEAKGYAVVLPDPDTMAHAVLPGMEALERGDNEGARNLLGIGIQVLLVNAVNVVILAFSEASSVFPPSDPILKRCLSPTAALARATVRWVLHTRAESGTAD